MTSPADRASRGWRAVAAAAIGALAFALYLPSLDAELVDLDDRVMVIQDYALHSDAGSLRSIFLSNFYDTYYRPLHRLSFVIDAQLSGTELRGYHRTNAALHAAASVAVFGALLSLGYAAGVAATCSLILAVHPAVVSAVAWIPGRDNVLMTLFLLGCLVAWVRFLRAPGGVGAVALLGAHGLLLAAALFTKEAAIGFPAVALAFAWLWHREPLRSRRLALAAGVWLGVGAIFLGLRALALPTATDWDAFGIDALLRSWPAAFAMLGKLVLPLRLNAFSSLDLVSVVAGAATVVVLAVLTRRSTRVRTPPVLFGGIWFGVLLAPTLVQRTGLYDYGEYRLYWLAFGVVVVAAELLRGLQVELRRPLILAGIGLLCAVLGVRSLFYQRAFDGPLPFWTHMVEVDPHNGWGWYQIGRARYLRGERKQALAAYGRAQAVGFERVELYADRSAVRLDSGDGEGAARDAERALEFQPGNVHAWANLGAARLQLGDPQAAIEALVAALDPRDPEQFRYASAQQRDAFRARVHEQLGTAHYALGEHEQAERDWARSLELDPTRHGAQTKRIEAALARGDVERAQRLAAALRRQGGRLPPALRARLAQARRG